MKKINFLLMLLMLAFASEALAWKPILIGHRGSRTGVENTEQAFINGVTKHGCQALECDVKVTSDKKYVCWHDDVITTSFGLSSNCTIYTNTLATIQSKTLTQTRKSVKYTGKICTVERYLEICKQYNVTPVVELKWASGINSNDMSNFPGLYALFEKLGMVDKVIILTSMKASLEYIGQNYPKLKCQYLVNYITSSNISTCKANGWDISSCYYYNSSNYVTQTLVDQAHAAGLKVSLWTMNSETDYKKYAGYGANYVTTDDFIYSDLPELPGTDPNPTQADVTWVLNGGTVSGTLPTTITSTYTIPTPTRTGYVFLGWYSTNSTSGTKYTTLSAGFKGTVYAVWRETKVTWVLNGGKVYEEQAAVPSNEELMETFKADYNTYFSQSIATTREFSNFLYYGNSLGCDVSKMMTDSKSGWKWLGDYINTVSSAAGVTMSAEVNWRYSLTAFFACGAAGNYNADFTTAGQPTKWASAYQTAHGNTSGGATTMVEVTLPTRFSSTYTIPTPVKDGYDFVGWYNNANGTGTALKTLPAYYDGTVYAIWKEAPKGDVVWELNGGSVSVTLPNYIEGSAYTLPTPTKTGYVFLGWYDTNSTSGNKLTSLPVGYKGTVYALWREAKVTWVLNGGKVYETKTIAGTVVVPTNDSLWTAFKAYYKTFYNENRADQPINMVATFMTKGYKIMTDATSEYKWLGDYILSVATAQSFTLGEDEALWRWHVDAFFQANKHESWPVTADFSTAGKPSAWGSAYQKSHGGDATGGTTTKVEVTLPSKITSTYTIPTPEKEGSTFVGWYDNANGTGTALKTLPAYYDGTVYAIWKANVEEDVKWELNGGTVSVTLPSKIEGSAYTLPTPVKEGYVFLGWYDNAAGTGTALTSLPVGYKGTVYALWREAKVVWELNGGKVYEEKTTTTGGTSATVEVPTNDSLWNAFKPYYNTFYNLNRADQTIENVASFAAAYMYKIMTDASSEYKWLGDYVNSVATAQGYTLGEDESLWRWHAWAFFNASKHESWPITADFSEAGKPEKWGPAYQAAHGGSTTGGTTTTTKVEVTLPSKITGAPYTIPTPEKENATFVGWYDTNDTSGNKLTVLPVGYDGTVYAIWKENGPTTDVENIRPALDMDAPMYDVLGRQVDATYRGIIIQNGNKYLLR